MTAEEQAAEVLANHEDCAAGSTVEVHEDRTGTLHYPCGITVGPPVRGLANADRAHVAAALAAAGLLRARDDEEGGLTLTATDTHDRDAERAAAWERGYKTGYSYRGPFGASAGNPVPDNPYTADGGRP